MVQVSAVIPVFNSEASIAEVVRRIRSTLAGRTFEIILVNDGSRDGSDAECRRLADEFEEVRYIQFFRNFGQIHALYAGLSHSRGEACVILDDDLQNPPEHLPLLLSTLAGGYDFVFAVPQAPHQPFFRRLTSHITFRLGQFLFDTPPSVRPSSFAAINGPLARLATRYDGPFPYLAGHLFRLSQNGTTITVECPPRRHGRSQYSIVRLVRLWLNGITNFSNVPLRLVSLAGVLISLVGVMAGLTITAAKLGGMDFQAGWASLISAIVLFSGIQLLSLGVIGEYLGRIFAIVSQTPQSAIRCRLKLPAPDESERNSREVVS